MDRKAIEQKLESLRHCLQRIDLKCPADPPSLAADPDLQDIVVLNLSRAVQVCVDIGAHIEASMQVPLPETMGHTFDFLAPAGVLPGALAGRMKEAVGFRNIAVHGHEPIDWHIVHSIAKKRQVAFSGFARAVSFNCMQRP